MKNSLEKPIMYFNSVVILRSLRPPNQSHTQSQVRSVTEPSPFQITTKSTCRKMSQQGKAEEIIQKKVNCGHLQRICKALVKIKSGRTTNLFYHLNWSPPAAAPHRQYEANKAEQTRLCLLQ